MILKVSIAEFECRLIDEVSPKTNVTPNGDTDIALEMYRSVNLDGGQSTLVYFHVKFSDGFDVVFPTFELHFVIAATY